MMRLQKFMAHAGVCSRRKAEEHILNSQVTVNGQIVNTLGSKIDPEKDQVCFKGKAVKIKFQESKVYIALNKPEGVVSSCTRNNDRIVLDLVRLDQRIYPVGRLDKASKGLLLMTNDGDLHNRLSHPSFDHEKEYIVSTAQPVSDEDLKKMAQGMIIDHQKTRPATVKRISKKSFKIILKQGINRQIRKMVGKTGNTVDILKRVRIAQINLGSLKEGQWRYLSKNEIKKLTQ